VAGLRGANRRAAANLSRAVYVLGCQGDDVVLGKHTMFGALIKEARERAGLTQRDLAELAQTTNFRVSTWERGAEGISLEKTDVLADALKLPRAKLIAGVLQYWLDNAEITYTVSVKNQKSSKVNTGTALKELRLSQGMPLRALARELQVAPPRVVDLERGNKLIKPETAWWYANALGVDHREPVRIALQDAVQRQCGVGYKVTIS
jgi:transcriptional regulator with XRE-family HTH domain